MNTQFIPLSGRTAFLHTYVLATDKQTQTTPVLSDHALTKLEQGRLTTKEVTRPYFAGEKTLSGDSAAPLKGEWITPWNQVSDVKLQHMSARAGQIALKRILSQLEWENLFDYLQECRKKMKENLHQYYLRIKAKHEEFQRVQNKNETLSI